MPYKSAFLLIVAIVTPFLVQATERPNIVEGVTIRDRRPWPNSTSFQVDEDNSPANGDLGATLAQRAGITTIRRAATAEEPLLRGMQRDNLNVTIDGQRLYGACPSHMDPTTFHIDSEQIEEVRIIFGPYDTSQPGGGLGGSIAIRSPAPQPGLHGKGQLGSGSFATQTAGAELSYGGAAIDVAAGYVQRQANVPEDGHGQKLTAIYGATASQRYRNPAAERAYDSASSWLTLGTTRPDGSRLQLSYADQDGGTTLYPYLKMDAVHDRTRRLAADGTWQKPNAWLEQLNLRVYWNDVHHLMDDHLRASSLPSMMITRPYMMQSDAVTSVFGATLGASSETRATTWQYGLDYYRRNWDIVNRRAGYTTMQPYTPLAMIPDVDSTNLGGYLAGRHLISPVLHVTGGIRYDSTQVRAEGTNTVSTIAPERSYGAVAANLQGSWRVTPALELFAGVARGTRSPDPQELYIYLPAAAPAVTWRGNPDLAATINHQSDIGLKYASETLHLDLTLFYSRLDNYIALAETAPATKGYRNISATLHGGEIASRLTLPHHFSTRASLAYVHGQNLSDERPLAEIPPLLARLALRYDIGNFSCEVRETVADRQRRVDSALYEEASAGWATTDLSAELQRGPLAVSIGVDNLFNRYYASHLSYLRDPFASSAATKVPEPGRYLYVNLAYSF